MDIEKIQHDVPTDPEKIPNSLEGDIEVEVLPDSEEYSDVELGENPNEPLSSGPHDANLADLLDTKTKNQLAEEIIQLVETNVRAREGWARAYRKGIELLGMKNEERTRPWAGACGVTHPLLMEAVFRFQSETAMETFPPSGPAKPNIMGHSTPEKEEISQRVARDMNWYMLEKMPEYRPEHERMLWTLGLAGQAFKKVYNDATAGRPRSVFVPPEDIVVPWYASNIHEPEWIAHIIRRSEREVEKLVESGFYTEALTAEDVGSVLNDEIRRIKAGVIGVEENEHINQVEDEGQIWLVEMHREFEFEMDGGRLLPYMVTVDLNSMSVLAVYRNWEQDDDYFKPIQYFAPYGLVPSFGAYCIGYAHILGGMADSATKIVRQLVDAGTLANLPGGFKTRGLRIKSGNNPISPGEFKDVDLVSGKIQENIMALPFKEPSQTLLALYQGITGEGRQLAAVDNVDLKGMSGETPVGTVMAILDKMFKPLTAIQSRVHYAMRNELRLLKRVIREYAPDDYEYDNGSKARKADYDLIDIVPASDPNASSVAVRMMQSQHTMQLMSQQPDLYDKAYVHRAALTVAGVQNTDRIIPDTSKQPPLDPVSENMAALTGKPFKVFPEQDHESHLRVHMNFLHDPAIAQMIGQSPNASQINGALMAHVQEHIAFKYRNDMQQSLGMALPDQSQGQMPPEVEANLTKLIADASDKLLQRDQAIAQIQQIQAQAQDPVAQLEREDLRLRRDELDFRKQKHREDLAMHIKDLRFRAGGKLADVQSRERIENRKLGAKVAADAAKSVSVQYRKGPPTNKGNG